MHPHDTTQTVAPARDPLPLVVVAPTHAPSFAVRALWFLFVGWWLSSLVATVGYLLACTVVGLPLAFACFNRIPAAVSLRPRAVRWVATADGIAAVRPAQRRWWVRALWFFPWGLLAGGWWMALGYWLCLSLVFMPAGVWMLDRVGAVMTLERH